MEIIYDEKSDGLAIIFSSDQPNRVERITKQVSVHLLDDKVVMFRILRASKHIMELNTVISRYYTKDMPMPRSFEVPRNE
jgi:ABC-type uncharacterized transport system ATPase subunit